MEPFLATWKFESSDNFDEYLKALGISAPLRKLAGLTSPTVTIKKLEDGKNSQYYRINICISVAIKSCS